MPSSGGALRGAVERGQVVPVGGSWVEPDCNLPSGESLVRQFLHGQRWFEREFGRRHREFWSPDAFGYAGQLPQILREAGITRFLTQKLSWNRFNRPEHHTLMWQGDDGSEVLAHYPPADTYNSEVTVPELLKVTRAYRDHDHARTSLLVYGYGDGGGGPTREMLETLRRAADLQGLPRTTPRSSEEFFDALEAGGRPAAGRRRRAVLRVPPRRLHLAGAHEARQPAWRAGAARRRVPLLCRRRLPRAELDRLWKLLLLQQFHDILPGSSIRLVYEDAERDLAAVQAGADALVPPGEVLANTVGFARREVVGDAWSRQRRSAPRTPSSPATR